jgi:hypothetical protein
MMTAEDQWNIFQGKKEQRRRDEEIRSPFKPPLFDF